MEGMTTAALSYACGASETPLRYETIGQAFDLTVAVHGEAEALIVAHQGVRWSWRELAKRVDDFAAGLIGLGLQPGDRLGIWGPTSAQWVVTQLACAKAGIILVTLNPAYRAPELLHALVLSGCRALVLADRFKTSDYLAMLLELAPELEHGAPGVPCAQLPLLEIVIGIGAVTKGMIGFDDVAGHAAAAERDRLRALQQRLTPDDPICIQFTSGTTGAPKGATLTHFGILNNGYLTSVVMGVAPGEKVCIPVPLFHCFGMVVGVLGAVSHGTVMVFPGEGFDPGEVLRAIEAERCAAVYGVPTMFIAELGHPDFASFDLSSLRTGAMGAAPCPEDIMHRVMGEMHMAEVTIAFGMTETSPVSFQTRVDADLETRISTVGTVHPWVEARVADENDRVVPVGTIGELHIRGYSVMAGYWGDEARTAETIDGAGWLRTGDLATMDAAGRCRIVGRSKDMIIRGGENVYPVEVENFLRQHPAIVDIAVFGMPDPLMGEEVCAWIKATEAVCVEDLKQYCEGRLAHYKVPRQLRLVDSFPMTASGKMHKPTMRDAEREERARPVTA